MEEKIEVESPQDKKQKKVELAISALQKSFGKDVISTTVEGVTFIPTGCLSFDECLGGGWARGRMAEIIGPESSGKSTCTLHAIAECQKEGGIAALIDAEMAYDPSYAANLGVNTDKLLIHQPMSAEQALDVTEGLISSGAVDLIIIDSVAALTPQAELDGAMSDNQMGLQARLMSKAMRKLTAIVAQTNTAVIWVNQIRMKIGVMWGNPEVGCGGNALKFYASQRVDIRKKKAITIGTKEDAEAIGNEAHIKCIKNKVSPPFRECDINIMYGKGIDKDIDLIRLAIKKGIITKGGAGWHTYENIKIGQGESNVTSFLNENLDVKNEIINKIKK